MVPYIQLENIAKSFGDNVLYQGITFTIGKGDRMSLIAPNGSGKTTLLNIIAGSETPDSGKITFKTGITVGFLAQEPQLPNELTILEAIYHTDNEITRAIKEYEKSLASGDYELIGKASELMDRVNGWNYEAVAKSILTKLKIDFLDQNVGKLSGGQKKRLALAILLIDNPDVFILDEPTNHLDLEMAEWLEEYLTKEDKTIFIVTHDRYFLDRVCTKTLEIDQKKVYEYAGGYNEYMIARQERITQFNNEVDKAQNLYKTELEWMRRMPQARGTKAKYRKDAFEEVSEKAHRKRNDTELSIGIASSRLGTKIFEIKNLNKSFGDKRLINDFSYIFTRYEKMGIVGKNGAGKSTFLNMLTGAIAPDAGTIDIGTTVNFGYYTQSDFNVDENKKVIEVARDIAEIVTLGDGSTISASQFLTQFLFPPAQQQQLVRKLSGGERRRLYLLTVLMRSPNFLVLDEPTNDLDIMTLNVLEQYLENFSGCVLVVSHDRFFMDKVVDNLLIFEGEGVLRTFAGNYTQYRNSVLEKQEQQRELASNQKVKEESLSSQNRNNNRRVKRSFKEQKEFESLETEISELEILKHDIELRLGSGELSSEQLIEASSQYESISNELELKEMRWLELSEIG